MYAWKVNDDYQGGVPDCFYEGTQRDLWVEYKYVNPIPKRSSTMIDLCDHKRYLSKLQQLWLKRRYNKRGDTAVILGSTLGGVIFWGLSWEKPIAAGDYKNLCMPHAEIMNGITTYISGSGCE